jgi:hypothetical protein
MEILDAQIVHIQLLERIEGLIEVELVVSVPRHRDFEFYCFHATIIPQTTPSVAEGFTPSASGTEATFPTPQATGRKS